MAEESSKKRRLRIATVPNAVTAIRLLIAPGALVAQQMDTVTSLWVCVGLLVTGELTDFIDGQIARRTDQISDVGKLFDPFADSIFRMLMFLGFMASGWMPMWMVAVAFTRDIIAAYMRLLAGLARIVFAARWSGKLKAVVQAGVQFVVVVGFLMEKLGFDLDVPTIAYWLLFGSTVITAFSAIDYSQAAIRAVHAAAQAAD